MPGMPPTTDPRCRFGVYGNSRNCSRPPRGGRPIYGLGPTCNPKPYTRWRSRISLNGLPVNLCNHTNQRVRERTRAGLCMGQFDGGRIYRANLHADILVDTHCVFIEREDTEPRHRHEVALCRKMRQSARPNVSEICRLLCGLTMCRYPTAASDRLAGSDTLRGRTKAAPTSTTRRPGVCTDITSWVPASRLPWWKAT